VPRLVTAFLLVASAATGCGDRGPGPAPATQPPRTEEAEEAKDSEEAEAEEADDERPSEEPVAEATPEPEPLELARGLVFPPGPYTHQALLDAIAHTAPRQFKPVGTSSVVFRMRLRSEHTAAFKPRSRQHRRGYRAEVAAYRLAQLLALDNVPPAVVRAIPMREIRERVHPRYADAETWNEIEQWCLRDPDGRVRGAAIYWVPEMEDRRLERAEQVVRWRAWLRQGNSVPEARQALARDLANMLAFDYLIGNWDRFSGGNMKVSPDGSRLFIRDHNVAFAARLPPRVHTRLRDRLTYTEKFSRQLIERIERMDEAAIERALAADPSHADEPLLNDEQIAGVLERRRTLLSYVGSLVDRFGEQAVLAFP